MAITKYDSQLPANIEQLSKFVLVGREKLVSIRAEIRTIDKLDFARDVRFQKNEEATCLAEALLDAEMRIGELIKANEPQSQRDDYGKFVEGSSLPDGISKNQSSAFQKMAEHRDVVDRVKAEAKEKDKLPTRTEVIRKIQKEERKAKQVAAKAAIGIIPISEMKYQTIVVDPPWPVEKIIREVRPNQNEFDYPTMSIEEIHAFGEKVGEMSADDCHLFMWTTEKYLPQSFEILKVWGFRYIFTMVWHKNGGFQPVNLAQYNCEFALYARKGTPEFVDTKDFFCCFNGQRREHSRKPDEFYQTIARVTEEPRIDIFSRGAHGGFDQYGNEKDKF